MNFRTPILRVSGILAVAGVVWLLAQDSRPASRVEPTPPARPHRLPRIEGRVRARARSPAVRDEVDAFVSLCAARGDEVVPELLGLLRDRPDVVFEPRWTFMDGRVKGYPTLRSAYIAALLLIPGQDSTAALLEVLDLTRSVEETFQIAHGLAQRGERHWTATAVERALAEGTASQRPVRQSLIELAAREDPVETSAQIVAGAPRGDDATDPHVLGHGVRALPLDTAMLAGQRLLEDASVTAKAKGRILRGLCDRDEIDVFQRFERIVRRGSWSGELRLELAYAAAGAEGFHRDAVAYSLARAASKGVRPHEIRARYHRRLEEVARLVGAALADLPAEDPRVQSLRRMLDNHRRRIK